MDEVKRGLVGLEICREMRSLMKRIPSDVVPFTINYLNRYLY